MNNRNMDIVLGFGILTYLLIKILCEEVPYRLEKRKNNNKNKVNK